MRLDKRTVQIAGYVLFIAVLMVLPAMLDTFWLNRISKYLVYGMLGVAISLAWGCWDSATPCFARASPAFMW